MLTPVSRHEEHGGDEHHLHVHEFHGMDGRHGESGRLFVQMVHLVEVLVQKRRVVHAVVPVRQVVLKSMQINLSLSPSCLSEECTCQIKMAGHWRIAQSQPYSKKS